MKQVEPTKTFDDFKDTITPEDYAKIRGINIKTARNIFNSDGFPKIPHVGKKLIADKNAVKLYDLLHGVSTTDTRFVLEQVSKSVINSGQLLH